MRVMAVIKISQSSEIAKRMLKPAIEQNEEAALRYTDEQS
jgi:hypothetical protein